VKPLVSCCTLLLAAAGCSQTVGQPVDPEELGYRSCQDDFECGSGRYCLPDSATCFADCRTTADCVFLGPDLICDTRGRCIAQTGDEKCISHADCGPGHYCNGVCSSTPAVCGSDNECPLAGESCSGLCAAHCGVDDDCRESCLAGTCSLSGERCQGDADCTSLLDESCTPVGLCMRPGWERWIPPGQLPPTGCLSDSECRMLGYRYLCDCDHEQDPISGRIQCQNGVSSVCIEDTEELDFGDGPADSPAHELTGIWGMRVEIAVVTVGLPLVVTHNSYSSNLFLVKASHRKGDTLELEERLCESDIINFNNDDTPYQDMIWMVIPNDYLRSLPILRQTAAVTSTGSLDLFETSQSVELRGCLLAEPAHDPMPTREEFLADPGDARVWDQDRDGHPGMTVYVDGVIRGRLYNIQRWTAIHHGLIVDVDHIRGLTSAQSEEVLLGTDNETLDQDTQTAMHDQADRTYFRMMRVDADTSCARLIREAHHADSWLRHTDHLMDVTDP
jgi:hypothetical protein